ncbi:MAG TPA: DUF1819 family protein [Synergistales bacterium]|nr:DUF1819 family protein [Synergistales bacterium]HPC76305.1 DUF1819 family protein [Synergistales bacterium]HRS48909.1 DUF1819 family protein [Thermovirgaceae bacterium]HRU91159.1 DUF1819 family protein [Thermovirgaceae bacterium]
MQEKYKFSFTAGGLLLNETVKIAEVYLDKGIWRQASKEVSSTRMLQKNKLSSSNRYFLEIKRRLKTLSDDEIVFLAEGDLEEQRQVIFLSICRLYVFIRDFVVQVLRDKLLPMGAALTDADYLSFVEDIAFEHPEYEKLTQSTQKKVKGVLFKILRETGFFSSFSEKRVTPILLSSTLKKMIVSSNPWELAFFLYSDQEIKEAVRKNG